MTIDIHPAAAKNFNTKASELINLIEEVPRERLKQRSFPSELHVKETITDNDIMGDIKTRSIDYKGNTITRFFYFDNRKNGDRLIILTHALI